MIPAAITFVAAFIGAALLQHEFTPGRGAVIFREALIVGLLLAGLVFVVQRPRKP